MQASNQSREHLIGINILTDQTNIIDLLELVLKGNDYELNEEMYQEVCGKRFSQTFASIKVAKWEEAALSKSSKCPLLYLDDILIIRPHSKEILNHQDDNIG